jgi:AGZA family xanthine/uracil permease-like MFS transporter
MTDPDARESGFSYPIFQRADLNGFWALFADNLANMIIASSVLKFVFKVPDEVVFGHVLPGLGVALIVGLAFYAWQAVRLARREGRRDVTALPYGISTPVMFVYLFGVIGPVAAQTDPLSAWRVGLAAAFVGGALEAAGCLVGPLLKRITPRAGMLGTLAGIALVWIATVPLAEIYEHPLIGFPALIIIVVGLVARRRLLGGFPAGLLAIIVGTAIGFATGDARLSTAGLGLYLPIPVLGDLIAGFQVLVHNPGVLAVVIPIEIYNLIETMNNVESAEAAGDSYDVRTCQLMDGVGTMTGALFGSAFPTTVYIGHPGYKRLGSRAGYALGVGAVFFLGSLFGLVAFLHDLIPIAAVAPMLVFIGLVITAQAFEASPRSHAMAVAMAMIPHVSNLLVTKMSSLGQTIARAAQVAGGVDLGSKKYVAAMLTSGIHWVGQSALSQGSILTGLLWGAAVALMVDGAFSRAAGFTLAAFLMATVGLIHAAKLTVAITPIAWGYLIVTGVLLLLHFLRPGPLEGDGD